MKLLLHVARLDARIRDTHCAGVWAAAASASLYSSPSSPRASEYSFYSPILTKPHFSSTRSEPRLSLEVKVYNGRTVPGMTSPPGRRTVPTSPGRPLRRRGHLAIAADEALHLTAEVRATIALCLTSAHRLYYAQPCARGGGWRAKACWWRGPLAIVDEVDTVDVLFWVAGAM